jgi:hypothetical protein
MMPADKNIQPFVAALKRMSGLAFAGTMPAEGWLELAKVLKEESSSGIAHAELIVDKFLRAERRDDRGNLLNGLPTPVELRIFARSTPAITNGGALPKACEECGAYGGYWRITDNGTARCTCPRGQRLRAMDAARESVPDQQRRVVPISRDSRVAAAGEKTA